MATRTKRQGGKGRAEAATSQPTGKRPPPKRTRTAAAAKVIVDRRQVLAFGMATAAAAVVLVPAAAEVAPTTLSGASFIEAAKHANALFEEWRRTGQELDEIDAALKTMSREDGRRSHYLVRVNDLPMERFRAALLADQALRDALRMKTNGRKEAAIKDALLLSLMEMTGKQPNVLRLELGFIA